MNEQTDQKPTVFFWILSVVALAWNSMGVYAYLRNVYMSEEAFAQMPEAEQQLMEQLPAWVTGVFAIAVFAGLAGSLGLVLRKRWAAPFFALSLIALVIQQVYNQIIAKMYTVMGSDSIFFSVLLVVIGIALYVLSRNWSAKGWLK